MLRLTDNFIFKVKLNNKGFMTFEMFNLNMSDTYRKIFFFFQKCNFK